ncbi:MAG: selenide, water dikinase SelD [Bacteroidia bacterium]
METKEKVRLTQFSKGGGCGCKIAPSILEKILHGSETISDPKLLVGYGSRDDAAVYETDNGNAVISTTDFFMPIVDDAFDFGRVASTNAISDVYAMGGKPIMAVAILGWPVDTIPPEVAREVLDGARQVCNLAGIPLAGGHSISSSEPIFGLAVTGIIKKEHIKRNNTARPGDLLFLTKPLGTGILSTSMKRGVLKPDHYQLLLDTMCTLNTVGEKLGKQTWVSAMTDVTGFGIIGHLLEMTGPGTSAEILLSSLPRIGGVDAYMAMNIYPDNTTRNYSTFAGSVKGMDGNEFMLLCDPQTSGGLLIAVDPAHEADFLELMKENVCPSFKIGRMLEKEEFGIVIRH